MAECKHLMVPSTCPAVQNSTVHLTSVSQKCKRNHCRYSILSTVYHHCTYIGGLSRSRLWSGNRHQKSTIPWTTQRNVTACQRCGLERRRLMVKQVEGQVKGSRPRWQQKLLAAYWTIRQRTDNTPIIRPTAEFCRPSAAQSIRAMFVT